MKLQFNTLKLFLIFLLLTCSVIIVFCPIGKSLPMDPIYECLPDFRIEYDPELIQEPIIPFEEAREIPVVIKARITGPADYIIAEAKIKADLVVNLYVYNNPQGVQATITPPILIFDISDEFVSRNATISIIVDKDLPANSKKNVEIGMKVSSLGDKIDIIKEVNVTQEIPFIIGYYPKISFVYLDGNVRNIGPDEIASFNFEIQNWGNSVTDVVSEVVGLPEGWSADIVDNTFLGSKLANGTYIKTISFKVKPPINFGYHEDRAIIEVSMIPKSRINSTVIGESHRLYFIVQSQGFSTPGFETVFLFIAIIFVILPMTLKKRKIEKGKSKEDRR